MYITATKFAKWCMFLPNWEEHKLNFEKQRKDIREKISRNVKFRF